MSLSAQAAATRTQRMLADAVALFPSGSHSIQLGGVPTTPPPTPPGNSALTDGATAAGERYVSALATVRAADEGVNATVARAIAVGQQGRERAVRVLKSFQTKAAAILPSTNTPEGLRLLASTSQQHLEAMSSVIADTKASNATLATKLDNYAADYRGIAPQPPGVPAPHNQGDDTVVDYPNGRGGIQTVGYGTGPGGEPPLTPPPPAGVTIEQLEQIMPDLSRADAERYLPLLNRAMLEGGIDTPRRQAAFLAQVAVESGQLHYMEELGDEAYFRSFLGDDWQYHGRGPIQLTHSSNYLRASQELGLGDLLLRKPELVAEPGMGFRTSVWFWDGGNPNGVNLNQLADQANPTDGMDAFRQISIYVRGNVGAGSHYAERMEFYRRAFDVLGGT